MVKKVKVKYSIGKIQPVHFLFAAIYAIAFGIAFDALFIKIIQYLNPCDGVGCLVFALYFSLIPVFSVISLLPFYAGVKKNNWIMVITHILGVFSIIGAQTLWTILQI